jgi:WD40 repeat protein
MVKWQPLHSDSFFIGLENNGLLQLSIRQRKVIKHYGQIIYWNISTLRTTPDKKHLFVGDSKGF